MKKFVLLEVLVGAVALVHSGTPAYAGHFGTGGGCAGYYGSPYFSPNRPLGPASPGWPSAYVGVPSMPFWNTADPQYSQRARDLNTYQSFYAPSLGGADTTIRVDVPDPNARVFFDDTPTRQQGMDRVFSSPLLDPNKTYTYTIRATWNDNGREVTRSQDVRVQAGQSATVDFRKMGDQRGTR
jgi:uncharacterized protein (TIGR03000 family)